MLFPTHQLPPLSFPASQPPFQNLPTLPKPFLSLYFIPLSLLPTCLPSPSIVTLLVAFVPPFSFHPLTFLSHNSSFLSQSSCQLRSPSYPIMVHNLVSAPRCGNQLNSPLPLNTVLEASSWVLFWQILDGRAFTQPESLAQTHHATCYTKDYWYSVTELLIISGYTNRVEHPATRTGLSTLDQSSITPLLLRTLFHGVSGNDAKLDSKNSQHPPRYKNSEN